MTFTKTLGILTLSAFLAVSFSVIGGFAANKLLWKLPLVGKPASLSKAKASSSLMVKTFKSQ